MMDAFFSCDWGTSTLRVRLVETGKEKVLAERVSHNGVLKVFDEWKERGVDENERLAFYQSVLLEEIKQLPVSSAHIPFIISGMASSNMGMMELPYKELPLSVDDDLPVKQIGPGRLFEHTVLLVSGIRSTDDVIRGEETQLLGCFGKEHGNQIFIFPGTHSKHILVQDGTIKEFKTFMTGEFFELLSKKSILASAVKEGNGIREKNNLKSFESGMKDSTRGNLLYTSFKVRTNQLFQKLSTEENYYYLSGLLLGSELSDLVKTSEPVTVVGNPLQLNFYKAALGFLGIHEVDFCDSAVSVIRGHIKIFNRFKAGFVH